MPLNTPVTVHIKFRRSGTHLNTDSNEHQMGTVSPTSRRRPLSCSQRYCPSEKHTWKRNATEHACHGTQQGTRLPMSITWALCLSDNLRTARYHRTQRPGLMQPSQDFSFGTWDSLVPGPHGQPAPLQTEEGVARRESRRAADEVGLSSIGAHKHPF